MTIVVFLGHDLEDNVIEYMCSMVVCWYKVGPYQLRGYNPTYTGHRGPPSVSSSSALYFKHLHNEIHLY